MDLTTKNEVKNNDREIESTRGYFFDYPLCDIYETADEFKLIFDIPGIEKEDVNIKVEKDVLTLTAECKKKPVEGYECIHYDYDFVGYKRSFNLNGTVNTDKIAAEHKNGTLTLTLPKKEEQKTKEIKINVS